MVSARFRRIALLVFLSALSFYIGYITNSTNHFAYRESGAPQIQSDTNNNKGSDEDADGSEIIIRQIQKCYDYNYFSDACVRDNHEIHRRVEEALYPKRSHILKRAEQRKEYNDNRVGKISSSFLTGSVSVSKQEFMDQFDKFGVATLQSTDVEDALLLYNSFESIPSSDPNYLMHQHFATRTTDTTEALENCASLNVQFVHNPSSNSLPMCTIYVPGLNNLPSYHIQHWMRHNGAMQHVGSLTNPSGVDKFGLPKYHPVISKHWEDIRTFLENVDHVLDELHAIIKERFDMLNLKDQTIITMTINRGDVDLMANFLCAAKSRHLDIRRILVFVTDEESLQMVESLSKSNSDELGVMIYHDKQNLGKLAQGGTNQKYGDATFISMMFAKILCVLYPSLLGYDVLYQDADIVWYDNPMGFFHGDHPSSPERLIQYDVIFQVSSVFASAGFDMIFSTFSCIRFVYYSGMGPHSHVFRRFLQTLDATTSDIMSTHNTSSYHCCIMETS